MTRRSYTPDATLHERAATLERVSNENNIPAFARSLLDTEYVTGHVVPDYAPVLDRLDTTSATLQLALDTSVTDAAIQDRLGTHADQLSDLATSPAITGEIAATLRSLAVDIQLVADATLDADTAIARLEGVQQTLNDIHTIFRTLHTANQHLLQQDLVDRALPIFPAEE